MKKTFLACLACVGLLIACTPEDNPTGPSAASLSVDVEAITADSEGGVFNVKVTCNVPTTTTVTYDSGDGWITLLPKVLKGDGTLSFTLAKFTEYDVTRSAKATIKGEGVEKVLPITQTGRPKPQATELDLDKYNVYADVIGGTFAVNVATAGAWTATSDAAWCTLENASGSGPAAFNIVVAKSEDYQYRTAKVTVTAGTLTREVFVQHVGTKIGDLVWANANVGEPDTFCETSQGLGKLYQWNTKNGFESFTIQNTADTGANGQVDKLTPGFVGGQAAAGSQIWLEENNPCPDGWRVPTQDELKALVGDDGSGNYKFFIDYWKLKGTSVSGVFCGLDRATIEADVTLSNPCGTIYIPIAGYVHSGKNAAGQDDPTLMGYQKEWWNAAVWSATTCGHEWDMKGLWMCGDNHQIGWNDFPSRSALSVRCVVAQ